MNWFRKLLERFGWSITRVEEIEPEVEKLHCIRFMTERGEQVGILLTTEEFEKGISRWIEKIEDMPIDTANPSIDERIS